MVKNHNKEIEENTNKTQKKTTFKTYGSNPEKIDRSGSRNAANKMENKDQMIKLEPPVSTCIDEFA